MFMGGTDDHHGSQKIDLIWAKACVGIRLSKITSTSYQSESLCRYRDRITSLFWGDSSASSLLVEIFSAMI